MKLIDPLSLHGAVAVQGPEVETHVQAPPLQPAADPPSSQTVLPSQILPNVNALVEKKRRGPARAIHELAPMGALLFKIRKKLGLTVEQFAAEIGVSAATLVRLRDRDPDQVTAKKIGTRLATRFPDVFAPFQQEYDEITKTLKPPFKTPFSPAAASDPTGIMSTLEDIRVALKMGKTSFASWLGVNISTYIAAAVHGTQRFTQPTAERIRSNLVLKAPKIFSPHEDRFDDQAAALPMNLGRPPLHLPRPKGIVAVLDSARVDAGMRATPFSRAIRTTPFRYSALMHGRRFLSQEAALAIAQAMLADPFLRAAFMKVSDEYIEEAQSLPVRSQQSDIPPASGIRHLVDIAWREAAADVLSEAAKEFGPPQISSELGGSFAPIVIKNWSRMRPVDPAARPDLTLASSIYRTALRGFAPKVKRSGRPELRHAFESLIDLEAA